MAKRFRSTASFKRNVRQEQLYRREQQTLRKETKKAVSRAKSINEMLTSLRKSNLYDESVAVDNLFDYLSSRVINVKKSKRGLIKVSSIYQKSISQLIGINKALDQFIKNKTSTVTGMKSLYEERRNELYNFIEDKEFVDSLSYEDIKTIYSVFQSNEYERTSRTFDSKSFFTLYTQAIDEKWTKEKFINEANYYIEHGNDDDVKDELINIYNNYISKYT